ncbi:MAG: hypothetical protein FJX72_21365, partial [Armatimonadetes bacterium]|nr:hypothetical protein [Armatimonadota bacterium]
MTYQDDDLFIVGSDDAADDWVAEAPADPAMVSLEQALADHEAAVDGLLKDAARYVSALKAWKKACRLGQMAARRRAADQVSRLSQSLSAPVALAAAGWSFDVSAWLGGEAWSSEIAEALQSLGLTAIQDPSGALLCPPLPIPPEPDKERIRAGRQTFTILRPAAIAAEIKRVRDRVAGARTQEFLEALYAATRHLCGASDTRATFRDVYGLFSLTPGWKKENTELDFGQMVYALSVSGLQATK